MKIFVYHLLLVIYLFFEVIRNKISYLQLKSWEVSKKKKVEL